MLVSNIWSHFQERLEWALTAKTNEMGGEGEEYYLSVSSAKLLLNLLMEFSSFSLIPACVVT